jgi:hypothetical protein
MDGITAWFNGNWFNLIQTLGIVGTLLFAGIGVHREAKAKEVENLLTLAEHHRELWAGFADKKELARVFEPNVDLAQHPPTVAEAEFLNLVFVHFLTGWWVAKSGGITKLEEMKLDVQGFFPLPLPRAVWEKTKKYRNGKFVRFVDRALATAS